MTAPEQPTPEVSRFRKKPVVIEAIQFTPEAWKQCEAFGGGCITPVGNWKHENDVLCLSVETIEGVMTALPNDWIIRGVKGEVYSCKPDIFAATYEPAATPPPGDALAEFAKDLVSKQEPLGREFAEALSRVPYIRDPPGDVGERAREIVDSNEWDRHTPDEPYDWEKLIELIAAALQSDRTAAASQARRETLEEAVIAALEQRCERTFSQDCTLTYKAGERTPWDLACTAVAAAIRALATPQESAPQVEESFQCPSCNWHEGHDPAEWFRDEALQRGFVDD